MSSLLRLEGVVAGYGSAQVLSGVSFEVPEGEIAVILGANGVGKTTTLRTISGLLRAWAGEIVFAGKPIGKSEPESVVRLGIATVPEPPGVFRDMSVFDNLRVGTFALGRDQARADRRVAEVMEAFPLLSERRAQMAGSLSGGEQRVLAVARAMMSDPRLLLVDEVSMGLSPTMVANVFRILDRLRREEGVTICMVEQNISALDIADCAYVMEKGRVVHQARGKELARTREEAVRAYLGAAESEKVGR